MAIFLVVALDNSAPAIAAAINQKFAENSYKIDDSKWFISTSLATSKMLSDSLGITADPPAKANLTGIVVFVGGYFGRGPSDMWEWLAVKSVAKTNA